MHVLVRCLLLSLPLAAPSLTLFLSLCLPHSLLLSPSYSPLSLSLSPSPSPSQGKCKVGKKGAERERELLMFDKLLLLLKKKDAKRYNYKGHIEVRHSITAVVWEHMCMCMYMYKYMYQMGRIH